MRNLTISGVILVILGVILLVYQGFSYTKEKKVIDVGPIQATATTHERVPIPPIIGWVVTVGGIVVLATGLSRSRQT